MVLVENLKFCERFVLWKIQPVNVFSDVVVRKQAFRISPFGDVLEKIEAFKDYKNNCVRKKQN